jgi:predicted TIM-barrel fold metal-dependent hydrolase
MVDLKLKDFRPVSIYNIPKTSVPRARFPVTDLHSHDAFTPPSLIDDWIKTMDQANVEKSVILSYSTGKFFDAVVDRYAPYKDRFEIWCGFDYTDLDKPGWQQHAIKELERCHQKGAKGVGELGDKGLGEFYSKPVPGWGLHIDDPRMKPLLEKCAELHMPISIHVAEDRWMYLPADSTNDGLINAGKWHVDLTKKGILDHDQMIATLENAVRGNPKTIFIACHFANCCADLNVLGRMLDTYPNLYADIAARFGEIAPIPRFVHAFMEKYRDRLVYGTDLSTESFAAEKKSSPVSYGQQMYEATFRILETADEHFYMDFFGYHWPLYGLSLSDETLKKVYGDNYKRIMKL